MFVNMMNVVTGLVMLGLQAGLTLGDAALNFVNGPYIAMCVTTGWWLSWQRHITIARMVRWPKYSVKSDYSAWNKWAYFYLKVMPTASKATKISVHTQGASVTTQSGTVTSGTVTSGTD